MKRFTALAITDKVFDNTIISPWVYINPISVSWVAPHWSEVHRQHSNSTIYFVDGTWVCVEGDVEETAKELGWKPKTTPPIVDHGAGILEVRI